MRGRERKRGRESLAPSLERNGGFAKKPLWLNFVQAMFDGVPAYFVQAIVYAGRQEREMTGEREERREKREERGKKKKKKKKKSS